MVIDGAYNCRRKISGIVNYPPRRDLPLESAIITLSWFRFEPSWPKLYSKVPHYPCLTYMFCNICEPVKGCQGRQFDKNWNPGKNISRRKIRIRLASWIWSCYGRFQTEEKTIEWTLQSPNYHTYQITTWYVSSHWMWRIWCSRDFKNLLWRQPSDTTLW